MKFPPVYTVSETARKTLYELDVLRAAWQIHPLAIETLTYLKRTALLKSSLFSARIEGNPLVYEDMTLGVPKPTSVHKREIHNLYKAYQSIPSLLGRPMSKELLLFFHTIVLEGISGSAGHFRSEDSAIFNQAGIAVYLTPAYSNIHLLLDECMDGINHTKEIAPVKAAVAHMWFEKIHPFIDGNGRAGRLLSALILARDGYDFGGVVPFEEYLDNNRQDYYDALSLDRQDVSLFIDFFLTALLSQAKSSLTQASKPPKARHPELLPRRNELVEIIREHRLVSFDFLSRRFRSVPTRTLHFDLSCLIKQGYVKKLGSTRGAVYVPVIKE